MQLMRPKSNILKRQARGKKSADERREISKQITEVRKALRKLDEEMCRTMFPNGRCYARRNDTASR